MKIRLPKKANQPGAVFALQTLRGTAYVQRTRDTKIEFVRILPGLYQVQPDLQTLVAGPELGWQFFQIRSVARDGLPDAVFIGRYPIPDHAAGPRIFVRFARNAGGYYVFVDDCPEEMPLTPDEVARLPRFDGIVPLPVLIDRILRLNGFEPDPKLAATPQSPRVTHFLYFQSSTKASRAKGMIEQSVGNVSTSLDHDYAQDGTDRYSLVVVDAEKPYDPSRLIPILERIAESQNGVYDGFDAPVPS